MSARRRKDPYASRRRLYFALVRELGLDAETRRLFQEEATGKASTKDWDAADWTAGIDELQIRAGRAAEAYNADRGGGGHGSATSGQVDLLGNLAWELRDYWRQGAEAFVRTRLWDAGDFRRKRWSGRWQDLWRDEASRAIRILMGVKEQVRAQGLDRKARIS